MNPELKNGARRNEFDTQECATVCRESPWKSRRLLTLETRMQVCPRNRHRERSQRAVATVLKRRLRRSDGAGAGGRAGHPAGNGVAGSPPAWLRRGVGVVVGTPGRHR